MASTTTIPDQDKICFVTGATGFVALNLIDELLLQNWKVYGLHRPQSKRAELIKTLDNYNEDKFTFVQGNLTCSKDDFLKLVPTDVKYIYHICHVRETYTNPNRTAPTPPGFSHEGAKDHIQLNLLAMKNILSICELLNVKRLIYCSSWSAYGILPAGTKVDENTVSVADKPYDHKFCCCLGAKNIPWPYGQAKLRCEEMIMEHCTKGLINGGAIISPCSVFGRFNNGGWGALFELMYRSKGKMPGLAGTSSFVDVQDLAKVFITAASAGDGKKCEKYIIGGTNETALRMQEIIGELVGYKAPEKSTPVKVIKFLAKLNEFFLNIPCLRCCRIKKKVIGSPLVVGKITQDQTAESLKAQEMLNYKPRPLKDILTRNYEWVVKEGMLK